MDQMLAMRTFMRVVEAGTFTKAADSMTLPKPTVTKLIQGLELTCPANFDPFEA